MELRGGGQIPFCLWLFTLLSSLFTSAVVGIKGPSGNVKFESVIETETYFFLCWPPLLLQTGDYQEAYGKPDGTRDALANIVSKMKERERGKTRRLTTAYQRLSRHREVEHLRDNNLFKCRICSQQKTVGFCLSFHKVTKLLIRLHCILSWPLCLSINRKTIRLCSY